jgi:hypothetical protein
VEIRRRLSEESGSILHYSANRLRTELSVSLYKMDATPGIVVVLGRWDERVVFISQFFGWLMRLMTLIKNDFRY